LFNAASTAPAPSPYGTAHKQSQIKEFDTENPNNAAAVINTLIAVTSPAPSFLVSLSDRRLDTIVPPAIIIVITPA
jgi:hypothetical protein